MLQNGLTLTFFFFFFSFYNKWLWDIQPLLPLLRRLTCWYPPPLPINLSPCILFVACPGISRIHTSELCVLDSFSFLPIRLKLYNMDRGFKQYSHYTNLEKEKLQRQFFSPVCLPFTISVTRLWMPNKTKVPKEGGGFCGGIWSSPWRNPFFFFW